MHKIVPVKITINPDERMIDYTYCNILQPGDSYDIYMFCAEEV